MANRIDKEMYRMRRGRKAPNISVSEFLRLKKQVDNGVIYKKEACEKLGISFYLYQKYANDFNK